MDTINLSCASCGAGITPQDRKCEYCGRAVVIKQFSSLKTASPGDIMLLAKQYEAGNITEACQVHDVGKKIPEHANFFTLGCCYLRLGLYDKALINFEKAMDYGSDNPENYFLSAIALLKGKKPFLMPLGIIKKSLEYLNAAEMLCPRSDFALLTAFIKYDFFFRKSLNITPDWQEELQKAVDLGISYEIAEELFLLLKTEIPDAFMG